MRSNAARALSGVEGSAPRTEAAMTSTDASAMVEARMIFLLCPLSATQQAEGCIRAQSDAIRSDLFGLLRRDSDIVASPFCRRFLNAEAPEVSLVRGGRHDRRHAGRLQKEDRSSSTPAA